MGVYLNPGRLAGHVAGPPFGKAHLLISDHGAARVPVMPRSIEDVPEGKVLICVVKTPAWEAALIVHDQIELDRVWASKEAGDDRPTTCLMMDRGTVFGMLSEREQESLVRSGW